MLFREIIAGNTMGNVIAKISQKLAKNSRSKMFGKGVKKPQKHFLVSSLERLRIREKL